jgi:hypothetical protein
MIAPPSALCYCPRPPSGASLLLYALQARSYSGIWVSAVHQARALSLIQAMVNHNHFVT